MKKAFTLAETLIAIAIIGVVAAITIPSCLSHYKKLETTSKLKKFYGIMEKAVQLAEYENGLKVKQFTTGFETGAYDDYDTEQRYNMVYNYWIQYFEPYVPYVKIEEGIIARDEDGNIDDDNSIRPTVYFSDGTTLTLWLGYCVDLEYDINGEEGPNARGRDRFRYLLNGSRCGSSNMPNDVSFYPYGLTRTSTRADMLQKCAGNGVYCSSLLALDNWEFKSDYPYKL